MNIRQANQPSRLRLFGRSTTARLAMPSIDQRHELHTLRWARILPSQCMMITKFIMHDRITRRMVKVRNRVANWSITIVSAKGFGGVSVMEIIAPFDGNTWRTVYTVRFRGFVYVLHAFQKKSKSGIATPKKDIELIYQRLAAAERDYKERQNEHEGQKKNR